MANENAFDRILNRMTAADTAVSEKTAAVAPVAVPDAAARMLSTVRSISETVKTAETAAPAAVPSASLERMAKEAQEAEQSQLLKEAHFMGSAIADGVMERLAQYDTALVSQGIKTASNAPSVDEAQLQKVAEAAYGQAVQDMEKQAEVEFNQGYNDQLEEIQKIAADIHYIGQQTASHVVAEARQST